MTSHQQPKCGEGNVKSRLSEKRVEHRSRCAQQQEVEHRSRCAQRQSRVRLLGLSEKRVERCAQRQERWNIEVIVQGTFEVVVAFDMRQKSIFEIYCVFLPQIQLGQQHFESPCLQSMFIPSRPFG